MRRGRAAATVLVVSALVSTSGAATPAWADGSLAVDPVSGMDSTPMSVTTSGGCPKPATNALVKIYGRGFPPDGESVVGNTVVGVSSTSPFRLPLVATLREFAADQNPPATLGGTYRLVLTCRLPLKPKSYADYTGMITFTSPHTYGKGAPGDAPGPPPPAGGDARRFPVMLLAVAGALAVGLFAGMRFRPARSASSAQRQKTARG